MQGILSLANQRSLGGTISRKGLLLPLSLRTQTRGVNTLAVYFRSWVFFFQSIFESIWYHGAALLSKAASYPSFDCECWYQTRGWFGRKVPGDENYVESVAIWEEK